jgi:ABC-type transport system involved in Fe-S cluster assembly fused permease/ATPase subunit
MVQTIVRGFPRVNVFCKLPFVDLKTGRVDTEIGKAAKQRPRTPRSNDWMKGRTVLAIAHQMSPIRDADKIIVLKNSVAAEQGTHDQLLAVGTYAELYSVQFNKIPAKAAL